MDQFEALVRLNQLRARKSKDLSVKWIVLSSLTCFLLLLGSFSSNWLYTMMTPELQHFSRDLFPLSAMGSMYDGYGSSHMGLLGGMGGYGGLGYGSSGFGLMNGGGYGGYGRYDLISTIGPFSACLESRTRLDFFGLQCRRSTESFLKMRTRLPTSLVMSEFLLVLGSMVFIFATLGSCCGCFGRNRLIFIAQSGAGLIYLLAIILYFGSLGDRISKMFCGLMTEPFYPGICSFGFGLYVSVIANACMFISSLVYMKSLSIPPRRKSMPNVDKV